MRKTVERKVELKSDVASNFDSQALRIFLSVTAILGALAVLGA